MKNKMMKLGLALMMGTSVSAYAVDACTAGEMPLKGDAHVVTGSQNGSFPGSALSYQLWFDGANTSNGKKLTYYDGGLFKAEWDDTYDFLARVGFSYDGDGVNLKTKNFSLNYRYTKNVESGGAYVGVHGWTAKPLNEFFIIDDWVGDIESFGRKFGEIEVDGAKYAIYALLHEEGEAFREYTYFMRITSIRETPRECGHISVSAHLNKFAELFAGQSDSIPNLKGTLKNVALKFGNLSSVMATVEAFGDGYAKGSIEYTYMDFISNWYAEGSSSSVAGSSASVAPESSSVTPESSADAPESSSAAQELKPPADSSGSTTAMPQLARISSSDRNMTVFDMQGRVLGKVSVPAGARADKAILAKFGRPGIYMVKASGRLEKVSVTK